MEAAERHAIDADLVRPDIVPPQNVVDRLAQDAVPRLEDVRTGFPSAGQAVVVVHDGGGGTRLGERINEPSPANAGCAVQHQRRRRLSFPVRSEYLHAHRTSVEGEPRIDFRNPRRRRIAYAPGRREEQANEQNQFRTPQLRLILTPWSPQDWYRGARCAATVQFSAHSAPVRGAPASDRGAT